MLRKIYNYVCARLATQGIRLSDPGLWRELCKKEDIRPPDWVEVQQPDTCNDCPEYPWPHKH